MLIARLEVGCIVDPTGPAGCARELIEGKGCELVYLPPYSPDYNPIEQAFSKLEGHLRGACARSQETLTEVMGEALRTITVSDTEGFFEHCGYRTAVQAL